MSIDLQDKALVTMRRGLSRTEAARYVGVSPRKFDQLVSDGLMPVPFRLGNRVIWDKFRLDSSLEALSDPLPVEWRTPKL